MGNIFHQKTPRCGLFDVFRRRKRTNPNPNPPRRSTTSNDSTPSSKSQKKGHNAVAIAGLSASPKARNPARPILNHQNSPVIHHHARNQIVEHSRSQQVYNNRARKSTPQPAGLSLSGELESMIADHQKSRGAGTLIRSTSKNFMLYGNLGNLRGSPGSNPAREERAVKYTTSGIGNVVRKNNEEKPAASLCRAVSTRMDPEQLKIMGNEDYKNGNFAEALALYDAAISIEPNKASYRSNRSAALVAMGKLLEAAFECCEAIRIDPFHQRTHNRLGMISVRLGEAERALFHFKQAGSEADPDAMNKAKNIQIHLNNCTEAKRRRDWKTLLRETDLAIAAGADSAPMIFGLRTEALVKMNRHEEAIQTMEKGLNLGIGDCTKFFGPIGGASLLLFHAQVDIVAGRFDDAISSAERASKLDPNNKEAKAILRRAKAVSTARSNGNELFRAARYSEAGIAYTEGISDSPYNAVLLCNRAACRAKLGQYQKAIEDCNAALNVRASYSKARLRRADCYTKMEKWGACIQDCEVLIKENPEDEEIVKMLKEAKTQLEKNGGSQDMISFDNSHATGMLVVSSNECFRDYVTSPGISVVLFCKKQGDRAIMQLIEQLNQRYPSVNFLKVDVEDHPSLAKSEGVNRLPSFIIYMNGSRAKEVPGDKHDLLETSIKYLFSQMMR